MWELDYKESWAPKNWWFWTVVLEKALESPLDCKEIQPVHHKGNQSWIFTGGTDAEAETPILWLPDVKNWLIGKDSDLGKIEGGRRRGWDCLIVSLTQWTWVWVSSGTWWRTGKPGVLQSMGLQRVRHDWATEMNWIDVWMWELDHTEGWAPKNWCFWTVVLGKTLETLWTARRSNQSILKDISPDYSLEELMLNLKLW